jgi:hypothetical protein
VIKILTALVASTVFIMPSMAADSAPAKKNAYGYLNSKDAPTKFNEDQLMAVYGDIGEYDDGVGEGNQNNPDAYGHDWCGYDEKEGSHCASPVPVIVPDNAPFTLRSSGGCEFIQENAYGTTTLEPFAVVTKDGPAMNLKVTVKTYDEPDAYNPMVLSNVFLHTAMVSLFAYGDHRPVSSVNVASVTNGSAHVVTISPADPFKFLLDGLDNYADDAKTELTYIDAAFVAVGRMGEGVDQFTAIPRIPSETIKAVNECVWKKVGQTLQDLNLSITDKSFYNRTLDDVFKVRNGFIVNMWGGVER